MWESLEPAASVAGDLATALAVAFAAYQLWLLNRHARIESHLNLIQSEREIWFAAMATPDISTTVVDEVWGISSPKNSRRNLFWAVFADNCEHMYLRHKAGVMSRRDWESMESYIGRLLQAESFRSSWADIKGDYAVDFAAYLDKRMSD